MNSKSAYSHFHTIDIPTVFKTYVSESFFSNCISCDKYLLEDDTEYVIEKVIKDGQVEVEYSMCMECVENMRKKMSDESLNNINKYFEQNSGFLAKRYDLFSSHSTNVDDYISNCLFKDKSIHESDEYQLLGHFMGKKLLLSVFPYMVCKEAIEEVQELLSAKTKDELDDFTNKHFGLPPDLKEILKTRKPVLF